MFKDIPGYEFLYACDEFGNIFSYPKLGSGGHKGKILKYGIDKDGYHFVRLSNNKIISGLRIHRLVAMTFLPNPNNFPIVLHLDNDPSNNSISNLKWGTYQENMDQMLNEGRSNKCKGNNHYMFGIKGKYHHNSKPVNQYSLDGEFIKTWDCTASIVSALKINRTSISSCLNGRYKTSGGFTWRFNG